MAVAAPTAPAQPQPEAAPTRDRQTTHRTHGLVAWKRAALAVRADGYDRVIRELARVRALGGPGVDSRSVFLLAHAYVASGQWQGKAGGYNLHERLRAGWPIRVDGRFR